MKGSIRKRGNTYTVYWSTPEAATGKRVQHTKGAVYLDDGLGLIHDTLPLTKR